MELGKFIRSRRHKANEAPVVKTPEQLHTEQIHQAQPASMLKFAEELWGPQQSNDGTQRWQTFNDIKGFTIGLGITNGIDYFVPYPSCNLDLSIDWQGYRPPMCRLYVEKNGTDDEITGIGGCSGPIYRVEELGTRAEFQRRVIYWENPIYESSV